ncbi:MAG: LD-carboxypeptidase [Candidatus Marinimicrobia bacterium]|nr:LD-carboxypeptidase [Candidatus Neomarinimicrobiota bacterium]
MLLRCFMKRRNFLQSSAVLTASGVWSSLLANSTQNVLKPNRLKPGDTIGILSPGGAIKGPESIEDTIALFNTMGFKTKVSAQALGRWGYFSGTDDERVNDLHSMFSDPDIQAIITTRGGSGCNRLLPLLDYTLIKNNPKIFIGYSDITALLNAITVKTGLVTFHGPVVTSTWNEVTLHYFNQVLMGNNNVVFTNPEESIDDSIVKTITPGKASGRLFGGNLSVLSTMIGSEYLPDWSDTILFLEDTKEDIYRIDRMLMHLKLAGILGKIKGFIFAQCTSCHQDDPGFSIHEILDQYIKPLGIPAWYGSMVGHIHDKFTLPIGLSVEINSQDGSIQLLEPAVI